ncbi:MAG: gamma-glutamyl-gamma-aminobutyrate hydrolase family protein [Bacteroidota bacterium]|nr:gamma-glutamyl-gamma-aminobutyrate hydrolase family protein [Bacteroidota bacterium]
MKIGISKSESKFDRYLNWLGHFKISYEILDFENYESGLKKLDGCSGLLLSGGVDIYPEIYCDWDTVETKGTYKPERDGFELKLFEKAIERKIPVLAICRGLQLVNVFYRGSLIFDLQEIRNVNHKKISDTEDTLHNVSVFDDTLLNEIMSLNEAEVNSSHHQAIDRLGEGLIVNAKSADGIIEGIEYWDKTNKPFMIGVQWHPERFKDFNSPASKNILDKFISQCEKTA